MKLYSLVFLAVLSLCYAYPVDDVISRYAKKHPNTETEPNPEYGVYFQGDIEIDGDEEIKPGQFNAMWDLSKRWPSNTIYYSIGNEYSPDQVTKIQAGIDDLVESTKVNGQSCVNIIPRTNEPNYVFIQKYSGCSSFVGMIGGGQRMSLVDSCVDRHGTIMHEFLHAFGYYHEHTRGDRDDYVYVNFDNIQPSAAYNFYKLEEGTEVDHLGTGYDYGSVMHYGAYGFAIDPSIPTIIPHDPDAEIGQRVRMSELDIERVQIFHCCLDAADSKYHKHLADVMRDYC